jgi:hypothetical protein
LRPIGERPVKNGTPKRFKAKTPISRAGQAEIKTRPVAARAKETFDARKPHVRASVGR